MSNLVGRDADTICAVSTPPGVGGISVIRVSGDKALSLSRNVAPFLPEKPESHRLFHGKIIDPRSQEPIDDVLISYFKEGRSFTGEEVLEISCHGSPIIVENILNALVFLGARTADRGEFTYRAFMNNKLDLVQAESVLMLIESKSKSSAQLAMRQLQGELSVKLNEFENELLWMAAHLEASIDFSTEGLDIVDNSELNSRLNMLIDRVDGLISSYKTGRLIKEGIVCSLVGRPNVGKSSLLNLLCEADRAIVTDQPGTTRDTIETDTTFKGIKFTLIDTAGIRDATTDKIEAIGIERSKKAMQSADINLFVFDLQSGLTKEDLQILNGLDPRNTIILANKIDLAKTTPPMIELFTKHLKSNFFNQIKDTEPFFNQQVRSVSALDISKRELVLESILHKAIAESNQDEAMVTNVRQHEGLCLARKHLGKANSNLLQGLGAEFLSADIKEAILCLQKILGKSFDDQIMDKVFKEFCLGK